MTGVSEIRELDLTDLCKLLLFRHLQLTTNSLREGFHHHQQGEGERHEASEADAELDTVAVEWADLGWRADQTLAEVRTEAQRSDGANLKRLQSLQSELDDLRDRQMALLQRRIRAEAEMFTRLGI